jgi:hypothetical protein
MPFTYVVLTPGAPGQLCLTQPSALIFKEKHKADNPTRVYVLTSQTFSTTFHFTPRYQITRVEESGCCGARAEVTSNCVQQSGRGTRVRVYSPVSPNEAKFGGCTCRDTKLVGYRLAQLRNHMYFQKTLPETT